MQNVDPDTAGIIERSMGVFGSQTPFVNGLDAVFDALSSFVTLAGINYTLLSRDISDDSCRTRNPTPIPTFRPTPSLP